MKGLTKEGDSYDILRALQVLPSDQIQSRALSLLLALEERPYPGPTAIHVLSLKAVDMPHSSPFVTLIAKIIAAWVSSSDEAEFEYHSRVNQETVPDAASLLMKAYGMLSAPRQRSLAAVVGHASARMEVGATDCLATAAQCADPGAQKILVDAVLEDVATHGPGVVRRVGQLVANAGQPDHSEWVLAAFRLAVDRLVEPHSDVVRQWCVKYWERCPDERALERLLAGTENRSGLRTCLSALLSLQSDRTTLVCNEARREGGGLDELLGAAGESTAFVDIGALLLALGRKLDYGVISTFSLLRIAEKDKDRSVESLLQVVEHSHGRVKEIALGLLGNLGIGPSVLARLVKGNPVMVGYDFLARNSRQKGPARIETVQLLGGEPAGETKIEVKLTKDGLELIVWALLEGCNLQVIPADHFGYEGLDFVCIGRDPLALVFVGVTGGAMKDDVRKLIETRERLSERSPESLKSARWLSVVFSGGSSAGIAPECLDHARREGLAICAGQDLTELLQRSVAGLEGRELLQALGGIVRRGASFLEGQRWWDF